MHLIQFGSVYSLTLKSQIYCRKIIVNVVKMFSYWLSAVLGSLLKIAIGLTSDSWSVADAEKELHWLNDLKKPRNCFQVIDIDKIENSESFTSIFKDVFSSLKVSYLVRDQNEILRQNIYDFEATFVNDTVEHPPNAHNFKKCNRILLVSRYETAILEIFVDSVKNKTSFMRFYPFTVFILITPAEPQWLPIHYKNMLSLGLHVFWMTSNYFDKKSNVEFSFKSVKNCLTNMTVLLPLMKYTANVTQFLDSYRTHPMLTSPKTIFRVSMTEFPPYIVYLKNGYV